jgi:hypothetical protein
LALGSRSCENNGFLRCMSYDFCVFLFVFQLLRLDLIVHNMVSYLPSLIVMSRRHSCVFVAISCSRFRRAQAKLDVCNFGALPGNQWT